jgi:hypothetical protein
MSNAKIEILDELYTLKINDNKRRLIFNKNGKLVSTKSYKINKNKEITPSPFIFVFNIFLLNLNLEESNF